MRINALRFFYTIFFDGQSPPASLRDWFLGDSWNFIESVGGIAVGEPTRRSDGQVFLPVRCDVSGLSEITREPTAINTRAVIRRLSGKVHDHEVDLTVKTALSPWRASEPPRRSVRESGPEGAVVGRLSAKPYPMDRQQLREFARGVSRWIVDAIKTVLTDPQSSPRCQGVMLGNVTAGPYRVYYRGSDRVRRFLAAVSIPSSSESSGT